VIKPLPCIRCDKLLEPVDPEHMPLQPDCGVMFSASGNYGSEVFDPMDRTHLEINLCDECVIIARDQGRLLRKRRPSCHHEHEIVEWSE
jgi:hypothetical protein